MAKHALFFNSTGGDRVYNAESFRTWLRRFFTNGVNSEGLIPSVGSEQLTSEFTEGFVHINGATKYIGATTMTHNPAAGSGTQANNPRYDLVVVEYNETEDGRDITLKIVEGQYTGDPSTALPTPVRERGIYQVPIASFKIGTMNGSFNPNTIELHKDYHTYTESEYGGAAMIISSTIINKTDEQLAGEFTTYYALFEQETEASFTAWYNAIRSTLANSRAGALKNNIDTVNTNIGTNIDPKQEAIDATQVRIDAALDALEALLPGGAAPTKPAIAYNSSGGASGNPLPSDDFSFQIVKPSGNPEVSSYPSNTMATTSLHINGKPYGGQDYAERQGMYAYLSYNNYYEIYLCAGFARENMGSSYFAFGSLAYRMLRFSDSYAAGKSYIQTYANYAYAEYNDQWEQYSPMFAYDRALSIYYE